eukprot:2083013-Prymnesium_polylepis.1
MHLIGADRHDWCWRDGRRRRRGRRRPARNIWRHNTAALLQRACCGKVAAVALAVVAVAVEVE